MPARSFALCTGCSLLLRQQDCTWSRHYLPPATVLHSSNTRRSKSSHTSRTSAPPPSSSSLIDDYYALLLAQPLPVDASRQSPSAAPSPSASTTSTSSKPRNTPSTSSASPDSSSEPTTEERARIVFGSRLAGPAARAAAATARTEQKARGEGEWVGGTWVPPRPKEPDNCCMSGCVNCVWDGYREDLEGWAAMRKSAYEGMRAERMRGGQETSKSIDDDGGGSEALWGKGGEEGALLEGVPVGISEFMRQEKKLAERKAARG